MESPPSPRATAVVITSQKGGVGKTTLSLNLAFALASRSWKTLLVDLDPQGSIGHSIAGANTLQRGLIDVLSASVELDEAILQTRSAHFDLLPFGRIAPNDALAWSNSLADGTVLNELFDEARSSYDLILVDTPPTASGTAIGALRCGDHAVVPLQAEPLAARSIQYLLDLLGSLREEGSAIELAGIVLTMLQTRESPSLAIAQESWSLFPGDLVFETAVPRDIQFLHASAAGGPVALLHRRPPAIAGVFDQLAAELELRIGLHPDDDAPIPLLG